MKLSPKKSKEMIISFGNQTQNESLPPITIEDQPIVREDTAKLVGITIQNNLKWDNQITDMIKKAQKKLYYLTMLKRSAAPTKDLLTVYKSIVRSQLEYAIPAWSTSLTEEQKKNLETLQKRAMKIIKPEKQYQEALSDSNMETCLLYTSPSPRDS